MSRFRISSRFSRSLGDFDLLTNVNRSIFITEKYTHVYFSSYDFLRFVSENYKRILLFYFGEDFATFSVFRCRSFLSLLCSHGVFFIDDVCYSRSDNPDRFHRKILYLSDFAAENTCGRPVADYDGVLNFYYFKYIDSLNYRKYFYDFKNNFKMFYSDVSGDYVIEFVFKSVGYCHFKRITENFSYNSARGDRRYEFSERNLLGFISYPFSFRDFYTYDSSLLCAYRYYIEYIDHLENFNALCDYSFRFVKNFSFTNFDDFNLPSSFVNDFVNFLNENNLREFQSGRVNSLVNIDFFNFYKKDSDFCKKVCKSLKVRLHEFDFIAVVRLSK